MRGVLMNVHENQLLPPNTENQKSSIPHNLTTKQQQTKQNKTKQTTQNKKKNKKNT
jgi:hypothetical protein